MQFRRCFLAQYFNSRPSARGDIYLLLSTEQAQISIHAPPRGATQCPARRDNRVVFQFTPLREGRPR